MPGFFHHIGTFLLFAAFVLLLVVSISAPVINNLALMKVDFSEASRAGVSFGTFGYCVVGAHLTDNDQCSGSHVGYKPARILSAIDSHIDFGSAARNTADGLTGAMVLHPVGCVLAFIAFLFAAGAGFIGSLFGAIVAVLAWIVTLVVMAIDFALFGIVKNHVNKSNLGIHAKYDAAMWMVLAAMICLFFGSIIVFLSCCSGRREKRRQHAVKQETYTTTHRKKRFGIF